MIAEQNPAIDVQKLVPLKLDEPQIDSDNPWGDDLLGRQDIAARLTNLVATQEPPLTIGLHGQWGTGKTFMLKRWQKALETDKYQAIYFNAWEDDFCDDPLLAIVGQLSDYFNEPGLKRIARRAAKLAAPLIMENLSGVLRATTGLTAKVDQQQQGKTTLLDAYLKQGATKNKLKTELTKLSKKIAERTNHPLIFIIDEMDRCRPTFAIELLERVKHIFDVPNLVFVFGLNRDELCNSIKSIYGAIDADVYLRRFFDMDLNLPVADTGVFAQHLVQAFELDKYFLQLSKRAQHNVHIGEFNTVAGMFPPLWGFLGLSLRDIEHCVRLIALVSRNLKPTQNMFPWALGLLITLRLKNLALYREYVQGTCRASDVINYFDGLLHIEGLDRNLARAMRMAEANLYGAESGDVFSPNLEATPIGQLRLLRDGQPLTNPDLLSKRAQQAATDVKHMIEVIENIPDFRWSSNVIAHLTRLIDLHQEMVRR